jgi:acyl-[acyl-carrier-protein]-phospholipid O-acyltransferase/long-chain-fatty-acid--[acyl-carrier-protein] ligase
VKKSLSERQSPESTAGFVSLLAVRSLTVLNDNMARWIVIGLGKRAAASVGTSPAAVLAIGTAVYVMPFVLFAWLAGWLADRYPKRSIVIRWKFAEVLIGILAAVAIAWGAGSGVVLGGIPLGLWLLLGVVGLFGLQTTLLNPSLLGTIPETVPTEKLSSANGIFALVSLAATLVGMAAGNWLADMTWLTPQLDLDRPLPMWLSTIPWGFAVPAAIALFSVATLGWVLSLRLPNVPAADAKALFPRNGISKTVEDLRALCASRRLIGAAAGIVFFWGIAAVAQLNVDQYAFESGATSQSQVTPLLLALVIGIGGGSLLAGRLSGQGIDADSSVNLGIVPVGGMIMAIACLALAFSRQDVFQPDASLSVGMVSAAWWLFLLGVGAGMFDVPLEAYLQEQSPPARLGATLASTNLLVFTGMLISSIGYYVLRMPVGAEELAEPLFSARSIFLIFSLCAGVATVTAIFSAPRSSLRVFVDWLIKILYRFRIVGNQSLPVDGPAVIVGNHISWLDGFLVVLASHRPVRMVVYGPNIKGRFLKRLAAQWRFILFDPHPKSIARALHEIESGLANGDFIGIFCEGGISRSGQLLGFKRGLERILKRVDAPAVPLAIDGLWGSIFSFSEGRFFTKWPYPFRRSITMRFGPLVPSGQSPAVIRLALQETAAGAVFDRFKRNTEGVIADAATAEAFSACCVLRRSDRLLVSLKEGDPLCHVFADRRSHRLSVSVEACKEKVSAEEFIQLFQRRQVTVWLAKHEQLDDILAFARSEPDKSIVVPEVIVVPVRSVLEFEQLANTLSQFESVFEVTPIVAYAPPECGLVAMSTPPSRAQSQEKTFAPDSVGRVVNGAVVWPRASLRSLAIAKPLSGNGFGSDGDGSLLVSAMCKGDEGIGWKMLSEQFDVDDNGFLRLRLDREE